MSSSGGGTPSGASGDSGGSKDTEPAQAKDGGGLGFDLNDIFEDVVEIDEKLKDLADEQEDALAEDLASELKELLTELEKYRARVSG